MRKSIAVLAAVAFISCGTGAPLDDPALKPAAKSVNAFGCDLYARLAGDPKAENLFFSPASISTALAMTAAGARGQTAEEMKKVLHLDLDDKALHAAMGLLMRALDAKGDGMQLSVANALWGRKGYAFLQEYLDVTRENYGAGLNEIDFAGGAEAIINKWVEDKTRDKIKDLLQPGSLSKDTRLVLTNAIHFKGLWNIRFKKDKTAKRSFHISADKTVEVDMMEMTGESFRYLEADGFQALELPYRGEEASMLILLPGKDGSLAEFEKTVTAKNLDTWISRMATREMTEVGLPRFKMTGAFRLAGILREMGMPAAFSESAADFSGMTSEKPGLCLSDVVHKAFVDVNEEGTEAAAATAVGMKVTAMPTQTVFRADRPFVFLIRHHATGAILFMGRVTNPNAS